MKTFLVLFAALLGAIVPAPAPPVSQTNTASIPVPAGSLLPKGPAIRSFKPGRHFPTIKSGDLELIYSTNPRAGFILRVAGRDVALGGLPPAIGYLSGGELRWFDCASGSAKKPKVTSQAGGILASFECADGDGATWQIRHRIRSSIPGAIEVESEISASQDRAIAFLPLFLLFPGANSFGPAKGQALFAGLEYLGNEPSSSEADVIGPASRRLVPDTLKITFPLMAVQAEDRFVALTWQMRPHLSAVFDSPDRIFNSGGHVLGLLFPGSNGKDREEGSLLPHAAELVRAGNVITAHATLLGGLGKSIVPAVQAYCQLRRPPPVPTGPEVNSYAALAAGGWLDSKIREGNLLRHALAGDHFKPQPAADAALWMEWLAARDPQSPQASRLRETATNVLSGIPPDSLNYAGVGHIRYPVECLVFGHVAENARHAGALARELLASFEPDGSIKYHAKPGGPDFGKTHFTNEASGLTSKVAADLLEAAAFSGERTLIDAALGKLRAMDKFHNGVPRGAQTWECPLHTPDILASAQMVKAYTLGYELSADPHFLEEARYWAWTGVPFVYLVNPTDKPVGLYSTIAVFGATQWRAPVWFGLPVQWCGLVYADALYRLGRVDPEGIWKRLADGITVSGMQQNWPAEDSEYQGLLPDSFVLRDQKRNGPAINPATVAACASQYFGPVAAYGFHCFPASTLQVHAPGEISHIQDSRNHVSFQVRSWVKDSFFILVNGLHSKPRVRIGGQTVETAPPSQFMEEEGRLILQLQGDTLIDLTW